MKESKWPDCVSIPDMMSWILRGGYKNPCPGLGGSYNGICPAMMEMLANQVAKRKGQVG